MDIPKPNFFIVGAARCGTTTVYNALAKHPNVFMTDIKEPSFFCKDLDQGISNWSTYIQLYKNAHGESIRGEASVSYLYSKKAAREIDEKIDTPKILIQLRDPLERSKSQYRLQKSNGREKRDFVEAVKDEMKLIRSGGEYNSSYAYIGKSMYYSQVKRYIECFGRDKVKVMFLSQLKDDAQSFMQTVAKYLGIKREAIPNNIATKNQGTKPIVNILNKAIQSDTLLKKVIKRFSTWKQRRYIVKQLRNANRSENKYHISIPKKDKKYIKNFFRRDVSKLESLIQANLNDWK
jgi:hypothetical protein